MENVNRDFNGAAKFFLGLSMFATIMAIINGFLTIKNYSLLGLNGSNTIVIEIVMDFLILVAAVLTFMKKPYGLVALTLLFIIRMFVTVDYSSSISVAGQLGGKTALLLRDFGLFAIAMCFRKDGIAGWKSMLASEEYVRDHTVIKEEPKNESTLPVVDDGPEIINDNMDDNNDSKEPVLEATEEKQYSSVSATPLYEEAVMGENNEEDTNVQTEPDMPHLNNTDTRSKKRINWRRILPIAIPSLCGAALLALLIVVLAGDYPENFDSLGDKFKYYFNLPNNRLAKEYLEKYRSAEQAGLDEMSKIFAETARLAYPSNHDVIDTLTHVFFELGVANDSDKEFYKKAIAISERGLDKYPKDVYLMDQYIRASYNLSLKKASSDINPTAYKEKAYTMAERLLLLEPLDPLALDVMCRKAMNQEDWNNLMKWSEKGLVLKESSFYSEFLYFNAKALFENHEYAKAQEMYFAAEKIESESNLHAALARIGGIPCKVLSVEIENRASDGKVITKAGSTIYDDNTRYLAPVLKVEPYRTGRFNFQVKLFHNGKLSSGDSSPAGYSFDDDALLATSGPQTIKLQGWGSDTPGNWDDGGYRVEIWWEGEQLYTYSFNIYSGFWHNLGYGNRFD